MTDANFTPEFDEASVDTDYGSTGGDIVVPTFNKEQPFRFWCQKALPLVYDDALSYYELLCRVVAYLNNMMSDVNAVSSSFEQFGEQFVANQEFLNGMAEQLSENTQELQDYINDRMDDFTTAYNELQSYVNDYFDNLDVQTEINAKLDEMAQDGSLSDLLEPLTEAWMNNATQTMQDALQGMATDIHQQDMDIAEQNAKISILEGRMDTFSSLPGGSTSGNAELLDIRTNFLGETFGNAGDAVRASDLIASGFSSQPFTDVEITANSVYTAFFDVTNYKGGKCAIILNSISNTLVPLNLLGQIKLNNTPSLSGAITLENDNSSSADYPISNYLDEYLEKITETYSGATSGYRLLVTFSIPNDFNYSYIGITYRTDITGASMPNFIAYASNWDKTPVDATLSHEGEAADAKQVGQLKTDLENDIKCIIGSEQQEIDMNDLTIVSGSYIASNGTIGTNGSYEYCSNYVEIEKGWKSITSNRYITTLAGLEFAQNQTVFFYDASKNFISGVTTINHGRTQTAIIPYNAKYLRANFSKYHSVNFLKVNYSGILNLLGYVGTAIGNFVAKAIVTTDVLLKPNTSYYFVNNIITDCDINVFCESSSVYKQLKGGLNWCHFTTGATGGPLKLYNYTGDLIAYSISVYEVNSNEEKISRVPEIYRVSLASNRGDYTSITQCFLDLKDNINEKIIYIDGGTYNIYQEYVNANVPVYTGNSPATEYMDYNVWVPQNTHIIGLGKVILSWQPTPTSNPSITVAQCQTVSPLNVRGNCIIENIDIICKNGRYCIHDDSQGIKAYAFSKRLYKNVRCYKKINDTDGNNNSYGYANTIGLGFQANCIYDFEGCEFDNEGTGYAFYGHTRQTLGSANIQGIQSPSIHLTNCIINTQRVDYSTKLGNSGSATSQEIKTIFNSCYLSGGIEVSDESGQTGNNPNAFNITLLMCSNVTVLVYYSTNPYTPKIYR